MRARSPISRARAWLLIGLCHLACSGTLSPYERETRTASDAYSSGHYDQARRHFLKAAEEAQTERDRDEAKYRAAVALQRMGQWQDAGREFLSLWQENPEGERAARALSDAAKEAARRGDAPKAMALHLRVVHAYPHSGLAVPNVRRYLALAAASDSERVEAIERLLPSAPSKHVAEALRWERALALENCGRLEDALQAYEQLATLHPYPYGAYWDDALMHGARLERKLGRPRQALEHLEAVLVERESAVISGSYERSAFAEAQFLEAEILRDDLNDPERARQKFRRVFTEYPTSLLRDDALWEEALISSGSHACAPLRLLVQKLPDSRYTPCAQLLCEAIEPPREHRERPCRDYIRRSLDTSRSLPVTVDTAPQEG